jgi:ketosteroid isomerase-like protein
MDDTSRDLLGANKAVVTRFFDALTKADFDGAARLIDPNGQWWNLKRVTRPLSATLVRIKDKSSETTTGLAFRVGTMTAEGDRVSVLAESYAEFPDGRIYNNLYHFLFRLADGRIVNVWEYYDSAHADLVLRGNASATR